MAEDPSLTWLALPSSHLRAYLKERGVDLRGSGLTEKGEIAALARATAARLGEGIGHASMAVKLAEAAAEGREPVDEAAGRSAAATERETVARAIRACAHCGGAGGPLSVCAACKSVSYCNRICQRAAWPAHKKECRLDHAAPADLGGAESQARKNVARLTAQLGADHQEALFATVELGRLLFRVDKTAEAEPLLRHTLARCEALFPSSDTTMSCLSILAENLRQRFESLDQVDRESIAALALADEAIKISRRAVAMSLHALGAEHESTLGKRINLAGLLKVARNFEASEAEFTELLEICPRVTGATSRLSLFVRGTYPTLLEVTDRLPEAERAYRDVLPDTRSALGNKDPFTLSALANYAGVLRRLGMIVEAEPLIREALAGSEAVYGPAHAYTLRTARGFARIIALVGKAAEAKAFLDAVIAGSRFGPLPRREVAAFEAIVRDLPALSGAWAAHKALSLEELPVNVGRADPRIKQIFVELARLSSAIAASGDAVRLQQPTEAVRLALVGVTAAVKSCALPPRTISLEQHADYLQTAQVLASRLYRTFRKEGLELCEVSLSGARALLGPGHAVTRKGLITSAGILFFFGRHGEAAKRSVENVEACRGVLGDLSEDTLHALVSAANMCKWAKDTALLESVTDKMRDVLESPLSPVPAAHPSVRAILRVRARLLLGKSGKAAEAEALLRQLIEAEQAVEACETPERFSPEHETEIRRFIGLANAFGALGELQAETKQLAAAVDSHRLGLRAAEQAKAGPGEDGGLVEIASQGLGCALLKHCRHAPASPARAAAAADGERLLRRSVDYYVKIADKARRGVSAATCSLQGAVNASIVYRHYLGGLLECTGRVDDARALYAENFAAILAERGPSLGGRPSLTVGEEDEFIGSFEHVTRALRKLGRFEEAAALDAAQVEAPPPLPAAFAGLCDRVGCRSGLLWRPAPAGAAPPPLTACATCKTAAYCGDECRHLAWAAGHRELCGRLNPAPRPLRLVAPRLGGGVLDSAGLGGKPLASVAVKGEGGGGGGGGGSGGGERLPAKAAASLDRLIAQRCVRRALLVVVHPWLHSITGAGGPSGRPPDVSVFEVMPAAPVPPPAAPPSPEAAAAMSVKALKAALAAHSVPLEGISEKGELVRALLEVPPASAGASAGAGVSAQQLADASRAAIKYIFKEEDRVAREPTARYENTGMMVRVGMNLPPHMAASVGAETDAEGRVTRLKAGGLGGLGGLGGFGGLAGLLGAANGLDGGGVGVVISPVVRWSTLGPFHCSEMTAQDISLVGIDVFAPRGWPEGWIAVLPRYEA